MPEMSPQVDRLRMWEHRFRVPLDHARPSGAKIEVFGREVVAEERLKDRKRLPWLVFFQGGPGFGAPRPLTRSGWLALAVRHYRVLLLDERGTGRSTPVSTAFLSRFRGARARARYLMHFRTDSIVRDAEWIRKRLARGKKWSVLGQSYGGFCVTRYLSASPGGLREAFLTGGLPSLYRPAEDVYRSTYPRVARRNREYYDRYPEDVDRVREIVAHLDRRHVRLPSGGRLTSRRFRQLGLPLGMSDGFEIVHYLLEEAWVPGRRGRELSHVFLRGIENQQPYETNPIFAILHEACYTQRRASRWAAERVRPEFPEFEIRKNRPVFFTGEMIYPWMFRDYPVLAPLRQEAEILARTEDWPVLYDPERLRRNTVRVAAAVYQNDMYVPAEFSLETAREIRGIRTWVTPEYEHNGLRADGEKILGRLMKLAGRSRPRG